jgi:hypothetical protein
MGPDGTGPRLARGSVEHDGTDILAADSPDDETTGWLRNAAIGGPVQPGRLPDGRPCLTIGDVRGYAAFNHLQGDNPAVVDTHRVATRLQPTYLVWVSRRAD